MSSIWTNPVLKVRALTEVSERRKRPSTYTEPLTKSPDMKDFLQDFYKNVYKPEKKDWYRAERARYPALSKNYDDLCGKTVSYEDFWMRYERRCDLDRVMQELAEQDAAHVEQTKSMVSSYINKAWGTPTKEADKEEDKGSRKEPKIEGKSTENVVKKDTTTTKQKPEEQTAPASPQSSLRQSISKALGTTNWSTPSPMAGPSSETPKTAPQESKKSENAATQEKEKQKSSAKFSSNNRTELHGVRKTEEQNSILSELKKNIMGSNKKSKSAQKEQATKKEPASRESKAVVKKSQPKKNNDVVTTTSAVDDLVYDNRMADTVAMLLFLVFLLVSNLPFDQWQQ